MPPDELRMLIEALSKQVERCLNGQDQLRIDVQKQLEALQVSLTLYVQKDRVNIMEEEIDENREEMKEIKLDLKKVREELQTAKNEIITTQKAKLTQTIALQGAILLLILGAFVNTEFPDFLHSILSLFGGK